MERSSMRGGPLPEPLGPSLSRNEKVKGLGGEGGDRPIGPSERTGLEERETCERTTTDTSKVEERDREVDVALRAKRELHSRKQQPP